MHKMMMKMTTVMIAVVKMTTMMIVGMMVLRALPKRNQKAEAEKIAAVKMIAVMKNFK